MSLGTGVLLGAVFVGLVLLYGQTKDRWRWRRALVGAATVIGLIVAGLVSTVWLLEQKSAREEEARIQDHRARHAVSIGDHADRVRQRQGVPDTVVSYDDGRAAFGYWRFRHEGPDRVFIFTAEGLLTDIRFFGDRRQLGEGAWLPEDRVQLGVDGDSVKMLLGAPCREEVAEQATVLEFETGAQAVVRSVHVGHGGRRVIQHGWRAGTC